MFKKIEQENSLILLNAVNKKTQKMGIIKSFSEDVFSKIKFSILKMRDQTLFTAMKSKKVNQIGNLNL